MKIPFADLFQRSKARLKPAAAKPRIDAPMPTAKKSESERLAKTVMPSTRAVIPDVEEDATAESTSNFGEATARQSPIVTEVAVAPPPPPRISMGAAAPAAPANLPPAVAIALAPDIERAISLPLEDVIAEMPEGYLKPRASLDVNRPIFLRATEVERGMAAGRPAIPVATLFQQAPEIFMHTVPSTDGAMVALPFERVMNALSNLARRRDQTAVQAVPQVETPFLQVTKEDTERFGTPMPETAAASETEDAAEGEELPPVRIEAATAEAYAAAVPEAADAFVPAIDLEKAKRIPFTPETEVVAPPWDEKFGTGEPAFPRVPASSGPPVPSAPAESAASASIPFSFAAPSEEAAEAKAEGGGPATAGKLKAEEEKDEGRGQESEGGGQRVEGGGAEPVLTLPLRPILQHLPPMQLGGNPATVSSEATVSFPMGMIAPQLALGKVAVKPNAFYAALPEEYRKLFLAVAVDAPVQLPLADVLAHLPVETLRMRDDQEEHLPGEVFETPFSTKAAEDAARLGTNAKKLKTETLKSEVGRQKSEGGAKFDAKKAVAKACALGGVQSCSVIFSDGLSIAGNIPDSMRVDGLSAMAPTLLQKLGKHMLETSLGPLKGMTVYGDNAPISFFTAGNVCLTALHSELVPDTRSELLRLTEEISRAYPGPSQTGGPSQSSG